MFKNNLKNKLFSKLFWIIAVLLTVMVLYNGIPRKAHSPVMKTMDKPSGTTTVPVPNIYRVFGWEEHTMATMFTTIKDEVTPFQYSTVKNWPLMCKTNINFKQPVNDSIRLVLFVNKNQHYIPNTREFMEKSKEFGWIVMNYTEMTNESTPFLNNLFLLATKHFQSDFYVYSNSDVLMGEKNMCKTLKALKPIIMEKFKSKSIMITGRRTQVNMKNRVFLEPESAEWAAITEGKLANPDSMEYYITDPRFPWREVKNAVIGRLRVDNYILYFSLSRPKRIVTIDGTSTITAMEQCGIPGNNDTSAVTKKKDKHINEGLYPLGTPLAKITGARFETRYKNKKTEKIGIYDKKKRIFLR